MHVHWSTNIKIVNCLCLLLSHSLSSNPFPTELLRAIYSAHCIFAFVLISYAAFFPISDSFSVDFNSNVEYFCFFLPPFYLCFSVSLLNLKFASVLPSLLYVYNFIFLSLSFFLISQSASIKTLLSRAYNKHSDSCFFFSMLNIYFPIECVECKLIDCITAMLCTKERSVSYMSLSTRNSEIECVFHVQYALPCYKVSYFLRRPYYFC